MAITNEDKKRALDWLDDRTKKILIELQVSSIDEALKKLGS